MQLDQTFTVTEMREFREGKLLVAKYLPGFIYRVTERNKAFVDQLEADGIVASSVKATSTARGSVSVSPASPKKPADKSGSKKKG